MRSALPRVSVVIPNWNGQPHLPECLETLSAQSFTEFEVLLVDNASTDGSVDWVENHHPEVCIICRPDNGGFSKAVNDGILAAKGEYVALLNNDTAVDVRWLAELVNALDDHVSYDFAASRMILYYEPGRLNAAGDVYMLWAMAGTNRGFGEPPSRYDKMERVLGACAGAALYRRALFDQVGLFDEDFFLNHEDTDFNLRCLIAGKRCLYVPAALIRHKWRASIETRPTLETALLVKRNEGIVAGKNLPAAVLVLEFVHIGYRLFRDTIPLRPWKWHMIPRLLRELPEQLSTHTEGIRMGLAKRPEVWRLKAVSTMEIIRWLRKGSGPI